MTTLSNADLAALIKVHLSHKDNKGQPTGERQLTDSQRQWHTASEIMQAINNSKEAGMENITVLQVNNAIALLVKAGEAKARNRQNSEVKEYAETL